MTNEQSLEYLLDLVRGENDGAHIDYLLPGYAAKRLISWQAIREDLLLCREIITRLMVKGLDQVTMCSLYFTCLSQYGRCFTDASGTGMSKLEEKDLGMAPTKLLEAHRELLNLRHNFVAHRGSTENEFHFAYLSLGIQDLSRRAIVRQLRRIGPKTDNMSTYLELFDFLIGICEEKYRTAAGKVWDHMLHDYPPENFAALKFAGPVVGDSAGSQLEGQDREGVA